MHDILQLYILGCYEEDGEWLGDCNVPESGDPTSWNRPYYQFAWNLCGLICIIAWVTITVGPLMGLFNYFGILRYHFHLFLPIFYYYLRVSADIEIKGMDTEKHNEPAYPDIAKGHGYDQEINARLARNSVVPGDIPNLSYGKTAPSDV